MGSMHSTKSKTIRFNLDGNEIRVPGGTTILEACHARGIELPALCWSPRLKPFGACRVCLVECDGQVVASCTAQPLPQSTVKTSTALIDRLRRNVVELALGNHSPECADCRRNHPCDLQALAIKLGVQTSRFAGFPRRERLKDDRHPFIKVDLSQCILCYKCVRACDEIQPQFVFHSRGRGFASTLAAGFNDGLASAGCVACGACTEECPAGALVESDLFQAFKAAADIPLQRLLTECHRTDSMDAEFAYLLVGAPEKDPAYAAFGTAGDVSAEMLGFHPQDASALKLRQGDFVEVSSRRGNFRAHASVTAKVQQGSIWLAHGRSHVCEKIWLGTKEIQRHYRMAAVRVRRLTREEWALPGDDSFELRPGNY